MRQRLNAFVDLAGEGWLREGAGVEVRRLHLLAFQERLTLWPRLGGRSFAVSVVSRGGIRITDKSSLHLPGFAQEPIQGSRDYALRASVEMARVVAGEADSCGMTARKARTKEEADSRRE